MAVGHNCEHDQPGRLCSVQLTLCKLQIAQLSCRGLHKRAGKDAAAARLGKQWTTSVPVPKGRTAHPVCQSRPVGAPPVPQFGSWPPRHSQRGATVLEPGRVNRLLSANRPLSANRLLSAWLSEDAPCTVCCVIGPRKVCNLFCHEL